MTRTQISGSVLTMILFFGVLFSSTRAQAQTLRTETQVVPEGDLHWQLPSEWRVLAFAGVEQGVDYPYQQLYAAAGLGRQFKRILRKHIENIDPDKEHYFLFGAGYERTRTTQSGTLKDENRITIDVTPNVRLPHELLVRDRNWVELRWINGVYQTTYRNLISVEHDVLVRRFHFVPYGSAEFWYDGAKHSWNTQWYTAGIEWPYKRIFMLDTYYRRENCTTCNPAYWNVAGIGVNFYVGRQLKR